MTYVVNGNCKGCKFTDCVEVCPVSCFYEGEDMVVIDPTTCIDCGVCVKECPVNAIEPEKPDLIEWIEFAKKKSQIWPNITKKKEALVSRSTLT